MNIGDGEIHLWMSFERPEDEPALAGLASVLAPQELQRLEAARSAGARRRFLAARVLQRTVLASYAGGIAPAALRFVAAESGKPSLSQEFAALGLHFNLTHTAGLVAIAVARHRDLGVDAENIHARTTASRIARRYFSAAETRDLEALPPDLQPARFFSLWTLKESWMKASGRGMAAGFDNATFSLDADHLLQRYSLAGDDATEWRFWQFSPSTAHVMALALRAPAGVLRAMTVVIREWRPAATSSF